MMAMRMNPPPFGLSLSKADRAINSPFDKLRANGWGTV